jgi:hypothetical protein
MDRINNSCNTVIECSTKTKLKYVRMCDICGSLSVVAENPFLLGCDTVAEWVLPDFRKDHCVFTSRV